MAAVAVVVVLAPPATEADTAAQTLQQARALFASGGAHGRSVNAPSVDRGEATAILSALAARANRLSAAERRTAAAILARPTDHGHDPIGDGYRVPAKRVEIACPALTARGKTRTVCVHWVAKADDRDAPPAADANGNGRPDWVETTVQSLRRVWDREVRALGYRMPLRDLGRQAGQGPNRGFDVYIADIGTFGISGYCTPDFSRNAPRPRLKSHAYCVIDNDYRAEQFPESHESGITGLKVTLAHEFFHAIQSAYDTGGAAWLREGTATWIEDDVFDKANANYRLLASGPLQQLEIPLDASDEPIDGDDAEYAAWIYWRFLSEYFGDPAVIRRVWERIGADRRPGGNTVAAITSAIGGQAPSQGRCRLHCAPTDFGGAFAEFALWNLDYPYAYEEGGDYFEALGCALFPDGEFRLVDPPQPSTGARELSLDRLSARFVRISAADDQLLEISVDLPDGASLGAYAQTFDLDGARRCGTHADSPLTIPLDVGNDGTILLPPQTRLNLVLVNGNPELDAAPYRYQAALVP